MSLTLQHLRIRRAQIAKRVAELRREDARLAAVQAQNPEGAIEAPGHASDDQAAAKR